jgi:hypothetical protein
MKILEKFSQQMNEQTIADLIVYYLREYGLENVPQAQSMAISLAAAVKVLCEKNVQQT